MTTIIMKGIYSTINFAWNDARKELSLEERKGEFPGMLRKRTFHIVLVTENQGTGVAITKKPNRVVLYDGRKQVIGF